jgi:hypothetical protein
LGETKPRGLSLGLPGGVANRVSFGTFTGLLIDGELTVLVSFHSSEYLELLENLLSQCERVLDIGAGRHYFLTTRLFGYFRSNIF